MLRPVHPQGGTTLKEKKWGESGTWWDLHLGAIIFISGVKWLICQITIWFQQGRNIVYSVLAFLRLVIQDLQQSLVKDLPHFVTPLWGTYCCLCALLKEVRLLIVESLLLNFFLTWWILCLNGLHGAQLSSSDQIWFKDKKSILLSSTSLLLSQFLCDLSLSCHKG